MASWNRSIGTEAGKVTGRSLPGRPGSGRGELRRRLGALAAGISAVALAVVFSGSAQAAPSGAASSPKLSSWFATASLPSPSDNGLALDTSTGNVFALTELGDNDETDVDADSITVDAAPASACPVGEEYCLEAIGPTGAVLGYVGLREESEYMAVDPTRGRHRLYVSQYDDEWPGARQFLAVVNLDTWAVQYAEIPYTYQNTGYEYDPEGLAVDESTGIVYIGAKPPEVEGDDEGGQGAILAYDGNTDRFLNGYVTAGDDPESTVFNARAHRVYTANEDDGTLTIAPAAPPGATTWDTSGSFTTDRPVFDAGDCAGANTYNPIEADKMAVDALTNTVYLTDDLYRVAAIPGDVDESLSGAKILRLAATCPSSLSAGFHNYANNLAIAPNRGYLVDTPYGTVRAGILYVTSESSDVIVVDLKNFEAMGSFIVSDPGGPAVHLEWPVINPGSNRFYVSDEQRPAVFIYTLKDFLTPTTTSTKK